MTGHDDAAVSVVVVTWNAVDLVTRCLQSLTDQSLDARRFHVVLVDNGSQDSTVEHVRRLFPSMQVVALDRNLGFGAAVNAALQVTNSPYVVLLNNDATAHPEFLESLLTAMERPSAHQAAAVTGLLVLEDSGLVNSTGNMMTTRGRGFDRDWQLPLPLERGVDEVFGFCGGAAALRRQAIDQVGGFDPDLFLYYEDTDLSWRMRAGGWVVLHEPSAIAVHRHAASSRQGSEPFHYWNERNSLIVFTRHAPLPLVLAVHLRRLAGLILRSVTAPRSERTIAQWRALRHHLRRLPRTVRERRLIWDGARVPREEVARLLVRSPG